MKIGCNFSKEAFVFEPQAKLSFFGKFTGLRTKLKKYMAGRPEDSRSVVLTCRQISFGIFGYDRCVPGEVGYCLFDPHGRNRNGFFDYSANACVMCFSSLDDLITVLARDQIFTHCNFECVPIEKRAPTAIELCPRTNNERCHLVTLHNSRRYVDAYLSAQCESESSCSSDTDGDEEESGGGETESDDDFETLDAPTAETFATKSSKGRIIKAPERYECESHPSFFRGKLREDRKRFKGRWKRWYNTKTTEQKKFFNLKRQQLLRQRILKINRK